MEEVRKQSEVASQKLKEKIYEKLDSAEENRQNQIKSIRLKLQEHVSTGYSFPAHRASPYVLVLRCPDSNSES